MEYLLPTHSHDTLLITFPVLYSGIAIARSDNIHQNDLYGATVKIHKLLCPDVTIGADALVGFLEHEMGVRFRLWEIR